VTTTWRTRHDNDINHSSQRLGYDLDEKGSLCDESQRSVRHLSLPILSFPSQYGSYAINSTIKYEVDYACSSPMALWPPSSTTARWAGGLDAAGDAGFGQQPGTPARQLRRMLATDPAHRQTDVRIVRSGTAGALSREPSPATPSPAMPGQDQKLVLLWIAYINQLTAKGAPTPRIAPPTASKRPDEIMPPPRASSSRTGRAVHVQHRTDISGRDASRETANGDQRDADTRASYRR